ncbi:hypothetical protein GQ53DRAFT_63840 [Thozetella sp. PMI_491]|nr:hypothetical protein GQ53DRAFT_63840 [Thozetella sp. PMI_491]
MHLYYRQGRPGLPAHLSSPRPLPPAGLTSTPSRAWWVDASQASLSYLLLLDVRRHACVSLCVCVCVCTVQRCACEEFLVCARCERTVSEKNVG